MSQWIIFALITALLNAAFDILIKLAGTRIDPLVGAFYSQTASIVPLVLLIAGKGLIGKEKLVFRASGAPYAMLAGVLVGIAMIAFLAMFANNAKLSIASPLILVARILITVTVGVLFLKESLTLVQSIGIIMSIIGLSLLIFK